MRKTEPTVPRRRHRGRWTSIALALGVPALVVPYLLLTRGDAEPVQVDSAAYYQFVSVRDGSALDVAGAEDGARIQQEKRATGAASLWQLKPVPGGFFQLVNHTSGKVLGVRGPATAEADVEQQPDTGAAAQQWQLLDTGDGQLKIVSRDSGMILGVTEGTGRRAVVQSRDRGGADQRWSLAKAAGPPGSHTWRDARIGGARQRITGSGGVLYAGPS
ncbi:RICIN domain-containing protein [Amycolatopsis tolypomycina]|uniref:Ricin-type beta-trefoil lectin domain-like n=1 Tax=Amycolatopsis tolypomycina TaxID=208445 RepID=A0A1H4Z8Q9_9PSEU|nr:RICIN domain-containing protein [Amycolatopsis tolypomycina]SED26636.1 Ricin-type beta-trefoil lectin domain-like [Amycolatopsis tolypomycina]